MRVLIVDDDHIAAAVIENALAEFGYDVAVAHDGREALEMVRTGLYRLVVSDWEMPQISGIELCRRIRDLPGSGYVYIILLTGRRGTQNVVDGLSAGADDFISKPFEPQELLVRLRAGERILALESRELIIFSLAKLAESRDPETGAHLERMREYCRILADTLAQSRRYHDCIDGQFVQLLYLTSPLHDIGKVGIPDRVLLKPGRLTPEEFEIMKQHTIIGASTLEAAANAHPEARFLAMARDIALTHHERFDGKGYPRQLAGDAIPLCGRIAALADVYDALTTARVYKAAYSADAAHNIILEGRGTQFDPDVVEAFLRCEEQFVAVCKQFDNPAHEQTAAVNSPPSLESSLRPTQSAQPERSIETIPASLS